jgi:Uma2 family endonuclease
MATATLVSIDEFLDLPDNPAVVRELLHGRVIEMATPGFGHGRLQARVSHLLIVATEGLGLDVAVVTHSGLLLDDSELAPDVYVVDERRAENSPIYRGVLRCVPDLAVEIVSPSEHASDIEEKVAAYLGAGVRTVWVFFPVKKNAAIHHADGTSRRITIDGALDAPEVLGAVTIPLASVFSKPR